MMRSEPNIDTYNQRLADAYDSLNYGRSLSGYFMQRGHVALEQPFGPETHFSSVVEVGSGAGEHLGYIRHSFDRYLMTDWNDIRLSHAREALPEDLRSKVAVGRQDATKLTLADNSADRLIACHILEHLYRPHEVLREWYRVLRRGGDDVDPAALRSGSAVARRPACSGRAANAERAGIEYDYWMAREHVNPIGNLVVFIRYYFPHMRETWYPTRIPSTDLNLFYLCHITKT